MFPDYGNSETVNVEDLKELPHQFYRLPFQVGPGVSMYVCVLMKVRKVFRSKVMAIITILMILLPSQ